MSTEGTEVVERITETITFRFDNEAQQRAFHKRLNDPNDWKRIAEQRSAQIERLREALTLVRSIITEGGLEGFQPLAGDWAERLFRSQAVTFAALSLSEGQNS